METTFKTYQEGNRVIIERLTFPRFTATVTFNGEFSDIEDIQLLDNRIPKPTELATAYREAGDYLLNQANK